MDFNVEQFISEERSDILDVIKNVKIPLSNDDNAHRVEIIILKYKNYTIASECLRRLITYTQHPYKLTIYDNRLNKCNTAKIWNKLIKETTCPYVLIMDSDAFVTKEGWLTEMMRTFEVCPAKAGIVVPVAGSGHGVTTVQAQDWKQGMETLIKLDGHISGYCFLMPKALFKDIGYFDERFFVFGQDSDFVERVIESDWDIWLNPKVLVEHFNGGSNETKKADENNEFSWTVDSRYAQVLYEELKEVRLGKRKPDNLICNYV